MSDKKWHAPGMGEVHYHDHSLMIDCRREIDDLDQDYIADDALAQRVCDALNNLSEKSEWISVEDRLPAITEEVLIWCGYLVIGYRSDDKHDPENHSGWVIDFDNGKAKSITYWQPLPPPPK